MPAQTGRTISRWTKFYVDDSAGTLREIPVNSINGVGLDHPDVDLTAFQDAIHSVLSATPDCTIEISGPFDNSAAVAASASGAAPALSGSHTVLKAIVGVPTPLALGICFGMRQYYITGEPAFGLNYSAGLSGFICTSYIVNPDDSTYTARFKVFGTVAPSWLDAIPTS